MWFIVDNIYNVPMVLVQELDKLALSIEFMPSRINIKIIQFLYVIRSIWPLYTCILRKVQTNKRTQKSVDVFY